jgi:hypothetical protein
MRDMILQLLPEVGVLGVPGVPQAGNPQKPYAFSPVKAGTPSQGAGVLSVPDFGAEHPEHLTHNKVFHEKANGIKEGTPRTPGTPDLLCFMDDIEAVAVKLQQEEPDVYKSREAGIAAAYEMCRATWLNRIEKAR